MVGDAPMDYRVNANGSSWDLNAIDRSLVMCNKLVPRIEIGMLFDGLELYKKTTVVLHKYMTSGTPVSTLA
jgi:hypothetical protein